MPRSVFDELPVRVNTLVRAIEDVTYAELITWGQDFVIEIQNLIVEHSPGTGRTYNRAYRGGPAKHKASAPFHPPAIETGKFIDTWHYVIRRLPGKVYNLIIASTDQKASWFEFGTSKMEPRPVLRIATQNMVKFLGRRLVGAIVREEEIVIKGFGAFKQ